MKLCDIAIRDPYIYADERKENTTCILPASVNSGEVFAHINPRI